jgi:hypothetical protein
MRGQMPGELAKQIEILSGTLGEDAWLAGAAGLILRHVFSPPTDPGGISLATFQAKTKGE